MGQDTAFGPERNNGNNIFLSDSDRPLLADGTKKDFGYIIGDPVQATVIQNEIRVGCLLEPRSGLMLECAWTFRSETSEVLPDRLSNYLRLGLSANLHQRHLFQTVR